MSSTATANATTTAKTMVLIDKNGSLKEIQVKLADFPNLYKKAGFSNADHFIEHYTWEITTDKGKYAITVWGKKKGKNAKNTYQFPPPLEDVADFCGHCILMNQKGLQNLTVAEWNHIYDILCEQVMHTAGETFDDEMEDEMDEEYDGLADEETDEINEVNENEEDEEIYMAPTKPKRKQNKNTVATVHDFMNDAPEETLLDCSAELQAEEYL